MKTLILKTIGIIIGISLSVSCSNKAPDVLAMESVAVEESESVQDALAEERVYVKEKEFVDFIPTQAASMVNDDGLHKFIRTARLKFKVKNTASATYDIERVILRNSGFIIKSEIQDVEYYTSTTPISKDSVLITRKSAPQANMVLRVPVESLDTTLRQIAPLASKIDFRTVEAEDVTEKLLADRLAQERLAKKQQRIGNAITTRNGRLGDAISAEDALDQALLQADNVKLSTYAINDKINYSTIYIELYQDVFSYTEKAVKEKEIAEYEYKPGFGEQALVALKNGWVALNVAFLALINIWPLIILLLVGGVVFVKYRKRKQNK